jgi:hypothetical protein
MEPVFRLIIKSRDGTTYDVADEMNLADFGGVQPRAGDFYVRTVSFGGQQRRQVFRIVGCVFKEHRVGILAEWADLPEAVTIALDDH